jgi:hypothetical protein
LETRFYMTARKLKKSLKAKSQYKWKIKNTRGPTNIMKLFYRGKRWNWSMIWTLPIPKFQKMIVVRSKINNSYPLNKTKIFAMIHKQAMVFHLEHLQCLVVSTCQNWIMKLNILPIQQVSSNPILNKVLTSVSIWLAKIP